MKRFILILAVVCMAGCGGGGGDSPVVANNPTPIAATPTAGKFTISMKADVGTIYQGAPLSIATITRVLVYKGIDYSVSPIYDSTTAISKGMTVSVDVSVSDCSNTLYSIYTTTGGAGVTGMRNAKSVVSISCGDTTYCTNSPDIDFNLVGGVNAAKLSCTP